MVNLNIDPGLVAVMKQDPRPVMRGTAAWALGRIGIKEAAEEIEKAKQAEQDEQVLAEMEKGLIMLQDIQN